MPFIDSIQQVFTENNASRISGRPDPDSRHDSADSVDDLRGNALGLFRTGLGFFEPGVKLSQVLFRRSLRRFAATIGHRVRSPILSLLGGCHIKILAERSDAWKDSFHVNKEKANLISQTGLYLCRQRPQFILSLSKDSHTLGACSTIGPAGLNFRVRDGNGWIPRGKITDNS